MITTDDVKAALGDEATSFTDETIGAVLAAEHAAQRSVLDLPSPRPPEADEALLKRVQHNLATTAGKPLRRVGIAGEGVRDLERPWSKRKAPTVPDATTPKPRGKRAAKKTATARSATTTQKETR